MFPKLGATPGIYLSLRNSYTLTESDGTKVLTAALPVMMARHLRSLVEKCFNEVLYIHFMHWWMAYIRKAESPGYKVDGSLNR